MPPSPLTAPTLPPRPSFVSFVTRRDEIVDLVKRPRPVFAGEIIADDQHRRTVGVFRLAQQHHRIVDIAESRLPHGVRHKALLVEGPQPIVEDLAAAFVGNPDDQPATLGGQRLDQSGQLAGPFVGLQIVENETRHGRTVYNRVDAGCRMQDAGCRIQDSG